jgi:sugar lactone lactonase YvrE
MTAGSSKVVLSLALALMPSTYAHPGSGIAVDAQGNIYFVDTGRGVWKANPNGDLTLISGTAYHWLALDEKGHFARNNLGSFDRGSFERVTPAGAVPTVVISSDYPIVVGADGGLYYVPFKKTGPRELVRRKYDGLRSVFVALPADTSREPMLWVNGIAAAPDGSLYVADNDAVRRIEASGSISTMAVAIDGSECRDPLPDAPKLPYLRGLAVARSGVVYAAANGCRSVVSIPPKGAVRIILKAERPWSPTGVAILGEDLYVLEYIHTPGDDRKAWIPRVRKVASDGRVTTVASIERAKD